MFALGSISTRALFEHAYDLLYLGLRCEVLVLQLLFQHLVQLLAA
jgi:hypothetical protein